MDKVSNTCKLFESCYMVHTTYLTVIIFLLKNVAVSIRPNWRKLDRRMLKGGTPRNLYHGSSER